MALHATFPEASRLILVVLWLGLGLAIYPVHADFPATRLLTLFPPGGAAGSAFEVIATGKDLEELRGMWISHPGISATLRSNNTFKITIDAGVPPGIYDFRVFGKNGVSNPRAFEVGVLPEESPGADNHRSDKPQWVSLGTTINGRATAGAADYFQFKARRGEFIVARCEAPEIDSRFEPVLVLTDHEGRELARSRIGGLIEWEAAEDGELTVSLHDVIFRGGPEFFYRLSIGLMPQIDSLLPLTTVSTNAARFVALGHNLPGGQVFKGSPGRSIERVEIELSPDDPRLQRALLRLPAAASESLFECRLRSERGVSNPVLTTLPTDSVPVAQGLKREMDDDQLISPPCEIAGEFPRRHQPARFRFEARKGDIYWMEVLSQQLGFPSDPFLLVQRLSTNHAPSEVLDLNDSEENLGGPSFNTKSLDPKGPKGRFEASEDATYRIQIRDLFTHIQGSPPESYRLVVRRAQPDFTLVAMPGPPAPVQKDGKQVPVSTTNLRRGGTAPVRILAFRRDGFDGPIEISTVGLPGGVSSPPAKIASDGTSTLLWLHAGGAVNDNNVQLKIIGSAEIHGTKVSHDAVPVTILWDVNDFDAEPVASRTCAQYVLGGLAEEEPVRLRASEEKTWEAVAGETAKIPLVIERAAQFTFESFNVTPVGRQSLESAKEFLIKASATNAVYELDLKKLNLNPGTYTFALRGTVKARREKPARSQSDFTLYSPPITLKVNSAPSPPKK